MTKTWQFKNPLKIIFGNDSINGIGSEVKPRFSGKALIVTDRIIQETGILSWLEKSLKEANLVYTVFDKVADEPTDSYIEEGLKDYKEKDCSYIIALGGGSPIDKAKAISAMSFNPGKISDYMRLGKIEKKGAPLIAIPTTAGTGSEVTSFTIITDTSSNIKMLIGSEYVIPDMAIVDPTLTLSCPPDLSAAVGIDALTHVIEAYVSIKANPLSDIFALKAIDLIYHNLKDVYKNGKDLKARGQVMLGSTMAGIAFGNSSVALVHRMSRPIGANFHIPHGVSNAALLTTVMKFSYTASIRRYADIAGVIGKDISSLERKEAARYSVDAVEKLIIDLNIPSLKKLDIDKNELIKLAPSMARAALESGSPSNNPKIPTREEIINLYLKAY